MDRRHSPSGVWSGPPAGGGRLVGRRDRALTERQLEVVGLVARGLPNKEIAARLGITRRAVEATLTRIYEKLQLNNRSALIAYVLSESGFGLAVGRRPPGRSAIGGLGAEVSIDEEAAAYAGAPFMVAVTRGPEHRYTFVNRIAAEVAGRPAENLVGRGVREIYPDLDPKFASVLDACYREGRAQSTGVPTSARWTHEDGSVRVGLVNLVFQPLRDEIGAVVGVLHIGAEVDTASAEVGPVPT